VSDISSQPSGRVCVWCGGTPVTAEHVWPQWIAKYLPKVKAPHHVIAEVEGEGRSVEFRGLRVPFTTKVSCVCEPCNTGWMAELEHTAEHELHAMIEGKAQMLHGWRQAIAATWAFKTAVMIEQAGRADLRAIPHELYQPFRQWLRPPPFARLWMATYSGSSGHFYGHGQLRLLITAGGVSVPNDLTAYGACLQVGALAFLLYGHLIQGLPERVPKGNLARCLIPIWPVILRAEWPPELAVDDGGLEMLVKSLGDVPPAEGVSPGPPPQ
jgi:hypothetical protein